MSNHKPLSRCPPSAAAEREALIQAHAERVAREMPVQDTDRELVELSGVVVELRWDDVGRWFWRVHSKGGAWHGHYPSRAVAIRGAERRLAT